VPEAAKSRPAPPSGSAHWYCAPGASSSRFLYAGKPPSKGRTAGKEAQLFSHRSCNSNFRPKQTNAAPNAPGAPAARSRASSRAVEVEVGGLLFCLKPAVFFDMGSGAARCPAQTGTHRNGKRSSRGTRFPFSFLISPSHAPFLLPCFRCVPLST
jgi:hypothetical protein